MTGDAPIDEPPPQVLAGGTPLIFDWRPVRWRKTRLMVALGVAVAGHLLVFYLFQVVSASSPRQAPPVRGALIVSRAEESTRRLLENVEDRLPSLSPPSPLAESDNTLLKDLVKGYVPTWQDHRPALKAMPGLGGAGPLPSLLSGSAGMLPPLPAHDSAGTGLASPRPADTVTRPLPVLGFQTGLADRALLVPPDWPSAVTAVDWPEEGPASFFLSVEPSGKVSSCLSLGTSSALDEEEVELLRGILMKLRFAEQNTSAEPAWGWVDVLW